MIQGPSLNWGIQMHSGGKDKLAAEHLCTQALQVSPGSLQDSENQRCQKNRVCCLSAARSPLSQAVPVFPCDGTKRKERLQAVPVVDRAWASALSYSLLCACLAVWLWATHLHLRGSVLSFVNFNHLTNTHRPSSLSQAQFQTQEYFGK